MKNIVISYIYRGFVVFLKVPVIIIIRFSENHMVRENRVIYIIYNVGWWRGGKWFSSRFIFVFYLGKKYRMKHRSR